jgi:integrase
MGVRIREKRGRLYLDIYHKGRRNWEALGLTVSSDKQQNREVMRLAEICRSKRELQVVSGEWGVVDHIGGKISLFQYITRMKQYPTVHNTLKILENYPGGTSIQIGQISETWLKNFQNHLLHKCGLNGSTPNDYDIVIRAALNKAWREKIILHNPLLNVKAIPRPEANRVHLSFDEVQKLANTPFPGIIGADIKRAFLFACYTGLRISDLKTLTWGNIEYSKRQIIKRQEKTKRKVFIPIKNTAWGIIDDKTIHKYTDPVFLHVSKMKDNNNYRLVKWAYKAGIDKKIGWHTARHTFAVQSLESGADIFTVSRLLGHTDIKTTQQYAKATDKMRREAIDALPQITIEGAI